MTTSSMRTLLAWTRAGTPTGGVIEALEQLGAGATFAAVDERNPLASSFAIPPLPDHPHRIVLYSGWLGEQDAPVHGVFDADFRTWTPAGWGAFGSLCENIAAAAAGREFLFLPHARHVLSDPQACMNAIRQWRERPGDVPFRLLVEPTAFLTPSMLDSAEDHLRRAFEALTHPDSVARPFVAGIVLSNVQHAVGAHAGAPDGELVPAPLDGGLLDPDLLLGLLERVADPALPVVLRGPDAPRQAERLRPPGRS